MVESEFIDILNKLCIQLTKEAQVIGFASAKEFENRVREVARNLIDDPDIYIDPCPPAQSFPDIAAGIFGIEVKFTMNDTWLSIANSILETNRVVTVEKIFIVFGKMGGMPEVRWGIYEDCVIHVRTSHVPRFEVEVPPSGGAISLFHQIGVSYDEFRGLPMEEKMKHIRDYARNRLKPGERLWWLEDSIDSPKHALPMHVRIYTKLPAHEKKKLRAEAVLLCPGIVRSGRTRDKYDDVALYLLTYHGVLVTNARDLFSAGSVANPNNDDNGGGYIERAIRLLESEIVEAAYRLDDALFIEYWGKSVPAEDRIKEWLLQADDLASGWVPSASLFLRQQNQNRE